MAVTPQAPGTFSGKAFDRCVAPDQGAMDAWKKYSPFGAIGIYVSGNSRYCGDAYQTNLTPTWIQTNAARGWRFLPIHVGYQSPCFRNNPDSRVQKKHMSTDPGTARAQARSDAGETLTALRRLGFGPGSASYLDLEWYSRTQTCDNAVLEFIDAWTEKLHAAGYVSGVYSSGSAAIKLIDETLTRGRAGFTAPDHIWFAWTNQVANTDGGSYLSANHYTNHKRIHQYNNNSTKTYGGRTMTIDWNVVDITATSKPAPPPPVISATVARIAAGSTPTLRRGSRGEAVTRLQRALQATGRPVPATGVFTKRTAKAVKNYRRHNGLKPKPVVSLKVWRLLQAGYVG